MKAQTLTPAHIFGYHVRYVVPLFQRPYVWSRAKQWEPLWADIRGVAESLLTSGANGAPSVAPHFLGAIVIDAPHGDTRYIPARHVIDGQQRLTTLQLILDAAQSVAERLGTPGDAKALRVLVLNEREMAQEPSEVFKVWPTDRDQAAFEAAMTNGHEAPPALASTPLGSAHAYFTRVIESWARADGDGEQAAARIRALTQALREHIKLVVIDLEPGDNAQVIFETLNHRGEPLLAADLIKNFIFQLASARRLDVTALYRRYWRDLDGDYWRVKVARARQLLPRIDIFVNYWLVMRLREEVPTDQVFVRFRDWVLQEKLDVEQLVAELSTDAKTYTDLVTWSSQSVVGQFQYRVLDVLDLTVVTPAVLWLLRWPEHELPAQQRDKALLGIESWMVRRALCRLTTKDINHMTLELLRALHEAGPAEAGDTVERFLLSQTADSRFWPSDEFVRRALRDAPLYQTQRRARIRMLLEAVEDHNRSAKSEQAQCPRNLTVEHVLPQGWREHWLTDIDPEREGADRDALLHILGNLTLVNHKLNPALSNRPWTDEEAAARGLSATGKRSELLRHSTLKLNADLVASDRWGHDEIRTRHARLVDSVLAIWPRPGGGPALGIAPEDAEKETVALATEETGSSGKYRQLTEWLLTLTGDEVNVTFQDLEDVIGTTLASSARGYRSYWSGRGNTLTKALAAAGYAATDVDLTAETAALVRRAELPSGSIPHQATRRDIGIHIASAFAQVPAGTFLTVSEIAGHRSEEYGADRPSTGAIAMRLFPSSGRCTVPGIRPEGPEQGRAVKGAVKL